MKSGSVSSPAAKGWALLLPALLLVGGAFLLYANTFGHQWTFDDFPVIVENPDIRSLGAFLQDSYPGRPLRELTYLLDYALFGLEPAGWHFQNILWHGLNALLLFALVRRLDGGLVAAWAASLLFLVHPIQVEVVANLSHRKDSLALAFSLLAVLAYLEGFQPGRRWWPWALTAMGLCGIAMLGKQNAALLPLVFLAYEWLFRSPAERKLLRWPRVPLLTGLLLAAAAAAWFFMSNGPQRYRAAMTELLVKANHFGPWTDEIYARTVLKSWAFLFSRLVWPAELAVEYTYRLPGSWWSPWVLAGIAGLTGVLLLVWFVRWRWPLASLGLVLALTLWVPASNLWPLAYLAADRYLYAPMAGLCLAAGYMLARLPLPQGGRWLLLLLPAGILAVFTWQQNQVWRSPETLWTQAVQVSPTSSFALNNMGNLYAMKGELFRSLQYYEQAARVNPSNPAGIFNLGWIYEKTGQLNKALDYYRSFLAMEHRDVTTRARAEELRRHLRGEYGLVID